MRTRALAISAFPFASDRVRVKVWELPAPEEGVMEVTAGGLVADGLQVPSVIQPELRPPASAA